MSVDTKYPPFYCCEEYRRLLGEVDDLADDFTRRGIRSSPERSATILNALDACQEHRTACLASNPEYQRFNAALNG